MKDASSRGKVALLAAGMIAWFLWSLAYWAIHAATVVLAVMALFQWDAQWARLAGVAFLAALGCQVLRYLFLSILGWTLGPAGSLRRD